MSLAHPHKEQLIAFGQGALAADESSQIEQHLEVCRECCETLLDLKNDTFVELLRIAKSQESDRRIVTRGRPATESSRTESDKTGEGQSPPPKDTATVLVQSGESIGSDELPPELVEHPRYRIVELIGRGGMGNVYRAEHRLMNRAVAIKLINSQLMQHPHAVERFRREVQAAAKLSHPNIVAAYDAEQAGNAHFLVMEFVEGTDLASVVKQRGPMSVAEACDCIRQAAAGLQHAHERGMVHRDIKPHNLMLAAGGQVRILDFGLAGFASESVGQAFQPDPNGQSTSESNSVSEQSGQAGKPDLHLTTAGSVMGTPDYMAPEQATDAHSADIRADIYSLGCTLHFLLTGKPPFEADNVLMKLKAHAQEPPPSLMTLRQDVPAELSKVAARMLAKNRAERYQTPAEVADALAPFAKPAALPPRRRVRTLVAAALFALLVGVIFVQTDKGRIEIQSDVDDVDVVVSRGGEEIKTIDLTTGSQAVWWFQSGEYKVSLKQDQNDIHIENSGFKLSRWGKEIVRVKRVPASETAQPIVVAYKKGGHYFVDGREANGAFDLLNRLKFTLEREPDREVVLELEKAHGMTVLKPMVDLVREAGGQRLRLPDWVPPAERAKMSGSGNAADTASNSKTAGNSASNSTPLAAPRDFATVTAYLNNPSNNRGGSVPVALLGHNGRIAFRFGNWLVVFDGIACDPKATVLGFSNFNVPQSGTSGEGTTDFGAGDKLPGILIKYKFAGDTNEISIQNHRFKLKGKATRLEFDDRAYDSTNSVQTIVVARDGSTKRVNLHENSSSTATQRTGLLTNPPKLPPDGLPVGKNLIDDPSLEDTPTGQLPNGWFAWLNDGPDFKCEVVEGGVTGKHCLQISGTGTRGVVFATSIPLDRTKRYALKSRVKVEGEAGTWAVVKLNYFNNTGWLGVDDRVGVTSSDLDWTFFEKTDAAERYPVATLLVPTCHIEGNGTAWFDDLEVIAYDREKLPADFDAKHGKNNRMK